MVDLYQASMKGKDKQIETNFIEGNDTLDPDDPFFDDGGASGKIDHLIGDSNMCYD